MIPNNRYFDNTDDKKEILNILENYLGQKERSEFLIWACSQTNSLLSDLLKPGKQSTWEPKEVFMQLMNLAFIHHLDLRIALNKLVELARKK